MALVMAAALLTACAPEVPLDKAVEGISADWVVVENTDSVKPKEGIASRIVELKGYDIIDWVNEKTILAYKYSDTVFGDDRGLVALDVETGTVLRHYESVGTYFDGSVSPDKKILAYTTQNTDRSELQFNLLNLDSGQTQSYKNKDLPTSYKLDTYMFRRNFRWHNRQDAWITLNSASEDLVFASLGKNGLEFIKIPYHSIVKKPQYVYAEYFSGMEDAIYGIVYDSEQSRLIKSRSATWKLEVLPLQNVINVWPLEERKQLLVIQKPVGSLTATVVIADPEGKLIKTLAKIDNLISFEVMGEIMVYSAGKNESETSLGLINVETGAESIVTTYTQAWIGKMKLSPNGDQLLVNFEYGGPEDQGKPISHLIQLK
jgi:hypothetical protein